MKIAYLNPDGTIRCWKEADGKTVPREYASRMRRRRFDFKTEAVKAGWDKQEGKRCA